MWVFFWPKCVKRHALCILQEYPWTDVDALTLLRKTKHHHSANIGAYVETIPSTISLPLTPISNELIMLMTCIY